MDVAILRRRDASRVTLASSLSPPLVSAGDRNQRRAGLFFSAIATRQYKARPPPTGGYRYHRRISETSATNNVLALAFGVLIVFLVVAGSLWIMADLNGNMMPPAESMNMPMQHH